MMYTVLVALAVAGAVGFACADSVTTYGLTVGFNINATNDDVNAVANYLREYDPGLEWVVEESLPPTGHATLSTRRKASCDTFGAELQSRPYVARVDCREAGDSEANEQ